jgi:hypothetical protein
MRSKYESLMIKYVLSSNNEGSLPYSCKRASGTNREGGTKSLSQQYIAASEATSNEWNEEVTFSEVLLSGRHALIKSYCLERL